MVAAVTPRINWLSTERYGGQSVMNNGCWRHGEMVFAGGEMRNNGGTIGTISESPTSGHGNVNKNGSMAGGKSAEAGRSK